MESQQRVQSVVAAHQVLEALATRTGGTSLSELARMLDMTPSRVLRHLVTLVELRLVERTGVEPVYRLGSGLVRLAERAALQHDVSRMAFPKLRSLNDQFGQATFLVRRQAQRALVWLSFPSTDVPHLTMPPGMAFSLSGSACGRALLAFEPDDWRHAPRASSLSEEFPDPVATLEDLELRLTRIRRDRLDSYGTTRANAIYSLAAPILDHDSRPVAAIGLVGFSHYYASWSAELTKALIDAADELSAGMGHDPTSIASA